MLGMYSLSLETLKQFKLAVLARWRLIYVYVHVYVYRGLVPLLTTTCQGTQLEQYPTGHGVTANGRNTEAMSLCLSYCGGG